MQLLETRRFHIEEIARWFGVPPVMIGHAAEGVTQWGTGVESIVLQWMTMGLGPLLTKIERRISKQLIVPGERQRVYAHFNREAIMAMDSEAKAKFIATMVQNGVYSRARVRELLEEPYVEGTDILTAQSNLVPLDRLGAASDARTDIRRALGMEENA
ncbi:MAG: phage portal protein [Rhizobiaceae bacterium]